MGKIVLTSYISHGAPTSLVERTAIHDVYERLGKILTERGVDSVVVSSPHYFTHDKFEVDSREDIPCIQDYYGFPEELYKFSYAAKNNPGLTKEIVNSSREKGLPVTGSQSWGLDHGAWLPLYFMFPERNVKVVPVSMTSAESEEHIKFGEAIKDAVEKVDGTFAVIGTGSPVHRLDLIKYGYYGEDKFEPGAKFDENLIEVILSGDAAKIARLNEDFPSLFHAAAPEGRLNPLYTALGASDMREFIGKTILHEFMYYGVSLVATIFSAESGLVGPLLDAGDRVAANRSAL
ncbi:MAG TPA: dioxygenase [Candidatus Kryptobacter bacterium]|nr:dioxygenase [Candidatus Kryptobacter bacterium]